MKNLILVLALTGCGGESFTGFAPGGPVETDGGFEKIAAGGGQSEDDGGVLPSGTGGGGRGGATAVGTGGATATGGTTTAGTGGTPGSGGATGTGGATVSTGGVTGTGGVTATGGVTGTGGTTACTLVTHDNGLGQTWQDCVALGTLTTSQAMKACQAWPKGSNNSNECIGDPNVEITGGAATSPVTFRWMGPGSEAGKVYQVFPSSSLVGMWK
jgi:hypothetical protein